MAKNNVNLSGLKSLYFALIHSHLSYCPIILNITSKSNLHKMEKVKKKPFELSPKVPTMPIPSPYSLPTIFCLFNKLLNKPN